MTEKERRLGQENAKLAQRINRQRRIIRAGGLGPSRSPEDDVLIGDLQRRADNALRQNEKLTTENRALRLYVAEEKIPKPTFRECLRLWLYGRML